MIQQNTRNARQWGIISAGLGAVLLGMTACSGDAPIDTPEAAAPPPVEAEAPALSMDPRDIHERLIVMDTHLDTPALLVIPAFDITQRHDAKADYSQVDLPRMVEGGLDGGFWVIYTQQGALTDAAYAAVLETALQRSAAIRKMVDDYPQHFVLATEADDAARIEGEGKRIVYQSIENAYPLGEANALENLRTFHGLGVRMLGPVHFANNQFGDSATDLGGQTWAGLSPLGEELVAEANRLGIILDGSHAHDDTVYDMIALSTTPIILSHTGAKAVFDHPRNIDDALLVALAESGGVIQMNALGAYLKDLRRAPERRAELGKLIEELGEPKLMTEAQYDVFLERRRAIDAKYPSEEADFEDYMDHFLHTLDLIGPDHVGVGADWDGGGGVIGMQDIAAFPRITERLLAEGYTEEDLYKIWGGNVIRLIEAAEAAKAE